MWHKNLLVIDKNINKFYHAAWVSAVRAGRAYDFRAIIICTCYINFVSINYCAYDMLFSV